MISLQYFYIGYESRGGVDVIPLERTLEKTHFRDPVLKQQKIGFFGGEKIGFFGKPGS